MLSDFDTVDKALSSLAGDWLPGAVPSCAPIPGESLPPVPRRLLVHYEHMTTTLEDYCGAVMVLHVLRQRHEEPTYTRLITLAAAGGPVVEVGIARMHLQFFDPQVRSEVLARGTPLGEILIRHNVLRRIEPRWYFPLPDGHPLLQHFGRPVAAAYGRIGVIHCDHRPAIELLEIVADDVSS